jgi:hypothetical protein
MMGMPMIQMHSEGVNRNASALDIGKLVVAQIVDAFHNFVAIVEEESPPAKADALRSICHDFVRVEEPAPFDLGIRGDPSQYLGRFVMPNHVELECAEVVHQGSDIWHRGYPSSQGAVCLAHCPGTYPADEQIAP